MRSVKPAILFARSAFFAAVLCIFLPCVSRAVDLPVPFSTPLWNGAAYNDAVPITGADRLHALGITGKGLTTAIIDSGFDLGHEIFDNVAVVNGYTYSGSGGEHGTHIAGIALGMAPDSNLWLSRYLGVTDDAPVAASFKELLRDAARHGIAALNVSWGSIPEGIYGGPKEIAASHPLTAEIVRALRAAGVAVVAAAGNASINGRMTFPDGLPSVLSVGSLNPYGLPASHGTLYRKPGLFLLAPGVDVVSADTATGGYITGIGTSLAAPHVTGAITLLKSGARAASTEEITAALYDSAARVVYDPDQRIGYRHNPDGMNPGSAYYFLLKLNPSGGARGPYTDWLDAMDAKYNSNSLTAGEWRMLSRIASVAYQIAENFNTSATAYTTPDGETLHGDALFVKIMEMNGGLAPQASAEFGFLQVDAAYRLLTSRRAALLAATAAGAGSAHTGAFAGFSGTLGTALDQNLVDLFQRLDGQPGDVLARAARQLGPAWVASTLQSSIFGQLGLHAATERRLAGFRINAATAAAPGGLMSLAPPVDWTAWTESFGAYHERTETRDGGGYRGGFAGVMAGMEKDCGEALIGGFAAWANHNIRGDGSSKGNWGTIGLYGGLLRDEFSAGLSASAGVGDYDLARGVDGPAASLAGMNYGAVRIHAKSGSVAASFSARGTAEWAVFDRGGWKIGPGAEAAFAHTFMSGFTEEGGGGINLSVRRHAESYAEGGAGLRVSKTFFRDGLPFLAASVKASGLYGAGFGGSMKARFTGGGPSFSVDPEKIRSVWFAPEATLSWRATDRLTVSAAYQGRFGKHSSASAGSLSVGLNW